MGLEDDVRAFDQTNRATVDKLRGPAPAGLIEAIIIGETCGDRFSLASDAALDETGLSSEPLYIAWKNDVDPCDTVGGIWLRCLCTGRDGMELLDHHEDLFVAPRHPYTEALMSAVPKPDPSQKTTRIILTGEVPSPANPPSGCYFHPRCPYVADTCRVEEPQLEEITPDHYVRCHRVRDLTLRGVAV